MVNTTLITTCTSHIINCVSKLFITSINTHSTTPTVPFWHTFLVLLALYSIIIAIANIFIHTPFYPHILLSFNVGSSVSLVPQSPSLTTQNMGTQTSTSFYFCIKRFVDDDAAINFYTGFESYPMLHICFLYLGKSANRLKYWGKQPHTLSIENWGSGSSRLLTPINEVF